MKQNASNIAIHLSHVSKRYTIHHEKPTLVERLTNGRDEEFWALKDINLTIRKGERVGIIGPNGSGKTTLLKIIASISTPTAGSVKTKGKVVSLIDLDAGFHPDLTGLQNIFLNGMLLGMKRKQIEDKFSSIIHFADIGQFIDTPLFTYSNGMVLRLGFAIAIHSDPDIIILDEAMAVGDTSFQKKCKKVIDRLIQKQITLVVVSHIPQVLKQYCKRLIILRKGQVYLEGGLRLFAHYTTMSESLF